MQVLKFRGAQTALITRKTMETTTLARGTMARGKMAKGMIIVTVWKIMGIYSFILFENEDFEAVVQKPVIA